MISITRGLEGMPVSWTLVRWVNQWDWLSIFVQGEWSADLTNGEIVDDFGAIVLWMTNENIGLERQLPWELTQSSIRTANTEWSIWGVHFGGALSTEQINGTSIGNSDERSGDLHLRVSPH